MKSCWHSENVHEFAVMIQVSSKTLLLSLQKKKRLFYQKTMGL